MDECVDKWIQGWMEGGQMVATWLDGGGSE